MRIKLYPRQHIFIGAWKQEGSEGRVKICIDCRKKKSLTAFNRWGKGKKSHKSYCKTCELKRRNIYRTRDAKGRASSTISKIKTRAKSKKWEFNLTTKWYQDKIATGVCEVTGLPLDIGPAKTPNFINPWAPSIGRVDSNKGYTRDNCQVVVWIYNRAKNTDTYNDVLILAQALVGK